MGVLALDRPYGAAASAIRSKVIHAAADAILSQVRSVDRNAAMQ
jgi:hypothetical protein